MPRFAANLSMMFPELEVPARFQAARHAGFTAVEFLRPYAYPIRDVQQWLQDAGLQLILINAPSGDPAAGERGLAALPGRQHAFRESFETALDYATELGAGMIHVLAGVVPEGASRETYEQTFVDNMRSAAEVAKAQGVKLLLEPLNTRDVPRYLHTHTDDTRRLIEAVGSDNLFLQYDLYHMQIMQGDLVEGLRRNLDIVGHIQFSSVPGRHEPQHGEVNLPYVFEKIDEIGYEGWVGCEYQPKAGTLEGLSWAKPYAVGARPSS
ncbi:MAG TPA: 2-oxo-tetronate isomerase [Dehalococcoidia bacterium]|nr:2-oxo-tetronate isomerase [Dehalococcoidia bacterium]